MVREIPFLFIQPVILRWQEYRCSRTEKPGKIIFQDANPQKMKYISS
jgi:hypothetical protein